MIYLFIIGIIVFISVQCLYKMHNAKHLIATWKENQGIQYWIHRDKWEKVKDTEGRISLTTALKKAEPYLDKIYHLRINKSKGNFNLPPTVYVLADKEYFYIFKDNYPWKAPTLETPGKTRISIKVEIKSGEVTLPEELR